MPDRNAKSVLPWLLAPLAAILLFAAAGSALSARDGTPPPAREGAPPGRAVVAEEVLSQSTYDATPPNTRRDSTYTVMNTQICVNGQVYLQSIIFSKDEPYLSKTAPEVRGFSTKRTGLPCNEWREHYSKERRR